MKLNIISEEEIKSVFSKLDSIDAHDIFILTVLAKGVRIPPSIIKETAYHFVQKDPLEAARLYLLAGEKREAFKIYDKIGYFTQAQQILECEEKLFSIEEKYHFYERYPGCYQKGLNLAREKGNKAKAQLFKMLLDYTK